MLAKLKAFLIFEMKVTVKNAGGGGVKTGDRPPSDFATSLPPNSFTKHIWRYFIGFGRPATASAYTRQLLQHFLNFREQTLTRRYSHELQKTEDRLHVVEGLLRALSNLDRLIEILRSSPDGTTAKASLEARLNLSERQADAILQCLCVV